jgi:hypothetical protein
MYVEK